MQTQYHYRGNSIYTDVFLKNRCAVCKPNCCGSNYVSSPKGTCYLSICNACDDFKDWHLCANWLPPIRWCVCVLSGSCLGCAVGKNKHQWLNTGKIFFVLFCLPQCLTQVRWFSCSLVYQGSRDSHCFLQVAPIQQRRVTSHSCTDGGRSGSECLEDCKWFGEYGLPFWDPLSCCCLCGFWKRHWDSMEELIEFQISCYITHSMMPLHTNIIHCWNNDKVNLAIRFRSQKKKNLSARIADP